MESQLKALSGTPHPLLPFDALEEVCFIISSEILHPRGEGEAHLGVPCEQMNDGRQMTGWYEWVALPEPFGAI